MVPVTIAVAGEQRDGPLIGAGVALGVGLGGFVDGIALHQLLQWHNMLSSRIPPVDLVSMKINMLWDGVFHGFTWLMTVLGLALLWRAGRREDVPWRGQTLIGGMALGWGVFNFAEGIFDHHIIGIHHVHPGQYELAWDLGFVASGMVLIGIGVVLIRAARSR